MKDDGSLLREYVLNNSESAFAELVQRHLRLAYAVALRNLHGDSHRAQDVTQTVFADLARKAKILSSRETLAGWVHISARNSSNALKRREGRRQAREIEAFKMNENDNEAVRWNEIEPVVDSVLEELGERDREIILLRFFERFSFFQIGLLLKLSEDAAQKRAARALNKMRGRFIKRGIASSALALESVLTTHAATVTPLGLSAVSIISTVSSSVAGNGSAAAITLMSTKTTVVILSVVAVAGLGSLVQYRENTRLKNEIGILRERGHPTSQAAALASQPADRLPQTINPNEKTQNPEGSTSHVAASDQKARSAIPASKNSPRSTAATVRTAIDGGDSKTLLEAMVIAEGGRDLAQNAYSKLPADQQGKYGSPDGLIAELLCATTPGVRGGTQIVSEELQGARGMGAELNSDPSYRTLHTVTQEETGKVRDTIQIFQDTDDGWKWVISKGLVTKRLMETGFLPPPQAAPKT